MPDNESNVAWLNDDPRVKLSTSKLPHIGVTHQAVHWALMVLERDHSLLVERRTALLPGSHARHPEPCGAGNRNRAAPVLIHDIRAANCFMRSDSKWTRRC